MKIHFPYVWKWKIGITGTLWERRRQTSKDVFGFYILIGAVEMYFAWSVEQFILNLTKGVKRQVHGKGGKEIRPWYIGLPVLALVYLIIIVKITIPFFVAMALGFMAKHQM